MTCLWRLSFDARGHRPPRGAGKYLTFRPVLQGPLSEAKPLAELFQMLIGVRDTPAVSPRWTVCDDGPRGLTRYNARRSFPRRRCGLLQTMPSESRLWASVRQRAAETGTWTLQSTKLASAPDPSAGMRQAKTCIPKDISAQGTLLFPRLLCRDPPGQPACPPCLQALSQMEAKLAQTRQASRPTCLLHQRSGLRPQDGPG